MWQGKKKSKKHQDFFWDCCRGGTLFPLASLNWKDECWDLWCSSCHGVRWASVGIKSAQRRTERMGQGRHPTPLFERLNPAELPDSTLDFFSFLVQVHWGDFFCPLTLNLNKMQVTFKSLYLSFNLFPVAFRASKLGTTFDTTVWMCFKLSSPWSLLLLQLFFIFSKPLNHASFSIRVTHTVREPVLTRKYFFTPPSVNNPSPPSGISISRVPCGFGGFSTQNQCNTLLETKIGPGMGTGPR